MTNNKLDLKLISIAIVVHVVIIYSIIDIYFKSPLIHGMEPINAQHVLNVLNAKIKLKKPIYEIVKPAKRLALFVADGLRADSFYKSIKTNQVEYLK